MKLRAYNVIPALLFAYLIVMSYIGRGELAEGHYLYYFGIIALTIGAIVLLRFTLRQRALYRARMRRQRRREKAARQAEGDSKTSTVSKQ